MATPKLTDVQCADALAAVAEHGGVTAAADALGLNRATMQSRVNEARRRKAGVFKDHLAQELSWRDGPGGPMCEGPERDGFSGYIVKGVSTYYDRDGEQRGQWVKTAGDPAEIRKLFEAAAGTMAEDLPRLAPVSAPLTSSALLATVYTLTDCHVGALAWHREGGADWDLTIAEDTLVGCFRHMISTSPNSELAVVNQLGDFLHWDGLEAVTPTSRHLLDADGRFEKVVAVAIRVLRNVIALALAKHPRVHVILAEGNHDIASSVWLRIMFAALYENEPRVTVEQSPLPYYALEWGKTLLAFHHGHLKKNDQLPLLFAAQFAEQWGRTTKRYCHTGHRHHLEEKEHSGMIVFQHPTLAARDAFAARGGWHALRSATAVTYHKLFGEVGRSSANPDMLQ